MKKTVLFFLFPSLIFSQINLDDVSKLLNQVDLNDVNNVINNVINKKSTNLKNWSGNIGDPNFNVADRIAINDVIDAYGIYWDNNNLKGYLSLFSDDAIGVTYSFNGDKDEYSIKSATQINKDKERMDYFIKNRMQRRHLMANTFFIELSNNYAHIKKYMLLLTTNNNEKTEILTPINYVFKLEKINGIWKIKYREINLDKPLDLPLID